MPGHFLHQAPSLAAKLLSGHKALASRLISVRARAVKVLIDIENRAEELDPRHPGSTFVHELGLYGSALLTGPFGSHSSDFSILVGFIARERAFLSMELRDVKPALVLVVL